jgi:hypothetical protein
MTSLRVQRRRVQTARACVLLAFLNILAPFVLGAFSPFPGDRAALRLAWGVACLLGTPLLTFLLLRTAWRARRRRAPEVPRLEVLDETVVSVLMIEAGAFFALVFGILAASTDFARSRDMTFELGALVVSVVVCGIGTRNFRRALRGLTGAPQAKTIDPDAPIHPR